MARCHSSWRALDDAPDLFSIVVRPNLSDVTRKVAALLIVEWGGDVTPGFSIPRVRATQMG